MERAEEFRKDFSKLKREVERFAEKYADYDFDDVEYEELWNIEDELLAWPTGLFGIKKAVYEKRVDKARERNRAERERDAELNRRYGYFFERRGRKPGAWGIAMTEVMTYEGAYARTTYAVMRAKGKSEEEIFERIKKEIPTITDEEIRKYLDEKDD